MLHTVSMAQHQCWTTDLWIFADVRNVQNVPHCFTTGPQSRKSGQYAVWQLLYSHICHVLWLSRSIFKFVSKLAIGIVAQSPQAYMFGIRERKGECGLVTCSALIWLFQDWGWWLPPDVFVCANQHRGLQNWEGFAQDWVEKPNLKADLLAMWWEIPQAKCKKVVSASYKLVSQ